jgi:hypothetical protein
MHSILLISRAVLDKGNEDSNSTSDHVCPTEDTSGPAIVNFVGNLTYHQFSTILSGSCAILSTLIIAALVGLHAANYSNPVQQRQAIRIALLVPWVALFSFLIVWRDDIGDYLVLSLDFGCAIALSAFLLFMCDLVLAHPGGFDDLFGEKDQLASVPRGRKSPVSLRVRFLFESCPSVANKYCSAYGTAFYNSFRPHSSFGSQPPLRLLPGRTANSPTTYILPTSGSRY